MRQDGREQTPDVVVIGRSVAQHCCCLGVELRRAHEVDGSIDLSATVFERPVQPEGDQVLDPSPDGRREPLVVDDEHDRLWLVTEMFINPRDNWVFRERAEPGVLPSACRLAGAIKLNSDIEAMSVRQAC